MTQDDTLQLSPEQVLFAFRPFDWETLVVQDVPEQDPYFDLKDPTSNRCQLCDGPRLTTRTYGEPALRVIAHFRCGHSGVWRQSLHTAAHGTAR